MSEQNNCPKCNSNWLGDEIPTDTQHHYIGTHWKREIGIDGGLLGIYDGIVAYQCPDCSEYLPRSNSKWALELFKKFMKLKDKFDLT